MRVPIAALLGTGLAVIASNYLLILYVAVVELASLAVLLWRVTGSHTDNQGTPARSSTTRA
jgi:hypothetical protein